jgi:hypothetical protein
MSDNLLTAPVIKDYALTINARGLISGSQTIDLTLGNYVTAQAIGGITWTFSNPPSGNAGGFILELTNGGVGTQTWPAGVTKWPGGSAPSLTVSGVDILVFITDDGGTIWRGALSMSNSS